MARGSMLRSGSTGSYRSSVSNVLRSRQIVFPSPQRGLCVLVSPHSHQHLLPCALLLAVPEGVDPHLIAILICVSLVTNDAERLSVGLLVSYIPSWDKCPSTSFVRFEIQ